MIYYFKKEFKKMNDYSVFAKFYDQLTLNVSYHDRALYFKKIIEKFCPDAEILLDLACGTGNLSIELSRLGFDVIAADSSCAMLSELYEKKSKFSQLDILVLNQSMQELDLFGTVDVTVSALDSINHVTNVKTLQTAFNKVSLFTNPGGLFIFDANTVYKHRNVLASNTFVYDLDNIYCVWQNALDPSSDTVTMDIDFFEKDNDSYHRSSDRIIERAYSEEKLTGMLEKAGFEVLNIFGDYNLLPPAETEQRIVFVAKKI